MQSNDNLGFTLKNKDEKGLYTLTEAQALCEELGEGWRLPTVDECDAIRGEDKGKIAGLKHDDNMYITSSLTPFDDMPLSYDFKFGKSYLTTETLKHNLRLVKDYPENSEGE